MKRIIYPNETGGVSVIIPAENNGLTIDQLARKDTPIGKPYRIADISDIPSDRTYRDAWEADFSNPDGYGIGLDAWMEEQKESI